MKIGKGKRESKEKFEGEVEEEEEAIERKEEAITN